MIELIAVGTVLLISILLLVINWQIFLVTVEMLEVTRNIYIKTINLFEYTKKTYEVLGGEEGLTIPSTHEKINHNLYSNYDVS